MGQMAIPLEPRTRRREHDFRTIFSTRGAGDSNREWTAAVVKLAVLYGVRKSLAIFELFASTLLSRELFAPTLRKLPVLPHSVDSFFRRHAESTSFCPEALDLRYNEHFQWVFFSVEDGYLRRWFRWKYEGTDRCEMRCWWEQPTVNRPRSRMPQLDTALIISFQ